MNFDGEYRRIGQIDIAPLANEVAAMSDAMWQEEVGRQQVYKAHTNTETIPLIFDPDMRHTSPTVRPVFSHFEPLLRPALVEIATYYRDRVTGAAPYFARIILVRLKANANIGSHHDNGYSLARAHRIHLPIVTTTGAIFGITGVIKHLAAGELWEINNRKAHAVKNDSPQARIHAIFDYVIPGEIVTDPDGQLVA